MIDWSKWNKLPTTENANDYPTITDVIDDIIDNEEKSIVNKYPLIKKTILDCMGRTGFYFLMCSGEKTNQTALMPTSKSPFTFYRGQSQFYEPCLPSLYRKESEEERLISYLQLSEFTICLFSHPIIIEIKSRPVIFSDTLSARLPICIDGLAQHYGIKTRLFDLTNNKWAAAFFATTIYKEGEYFPVDVNNLDHPKYGVLYRFSHTQDKGNFEQYNINPIGLQYFNRPGAQSAFTIDMKGEKDLHKIDGFERIFFRHDNQCTKYVYDLCQQGRSFFPKDSLAVMMDDFLTKKSFSEKAVAYCKDNYYPELSTMEYVELMKKYGLDKVEKSLLAFNVDDLKKEWEYWQKEGRMRFIKNIIAVPFFRV